MKIQLKNAFMWFIDNGLYHMTEENPGPIDIDFEHLPKTQQLQVIMGIRTGKISTDRQVDELYSIFNPVAKPLQVKPLENISHIVMEPINLAPILNKTISTIKKEIGLIEDIRNLRLLRELESQGKQRKSILSLIQSRLDNFTSDIQKVISNESNYTELPLHGMDKIEASFKIADEEVKKVTINK